MSPRALDGSLRRLRTERAVALLGEHFEGTTRSLLASMPNPAQEPAGTR